MPTQQEIDAELQQIYESATLRDDINDDEAEVLLKWGERQIERIARLYPNEFEQKCRFMRQLIKNINRFVGQREFNELDGQKEYMSKVLMYLPQLGFDGITEAMLFANLPADKADMKGTLRAVLDSLTPPVVSSPDGQATLTDESLDATATPAQPITPEDIQIENDTPDMLAIPKPDIAPATPEPNPSENIVANLFGMLNNLSANLQENQPKESIKENTPNDEKE